MFLRVPLAFLKAGAYSLCALFVWDLTSNKDKPKGTA